MENTTNQSLDLVHVQCCICKLGDTQLIGSGNDFEYGTSNDIFNAVECNSCSLVYLNPRPDISEFEKIYPINYHSLDFSKTEFGIVHKIRSRLETKRVLRYCKDLVGDSRILDVGCGDGFHLKLLRQYGNKNWQLEGIDIDPRAVKRAKVSGLNVHLGTIESINLPANSYDLVFMTQTIEHLQDPAGVLKGIFKVLKPGGKLVIVTDNTDSFDFKLFKRRYWGGYHFPRHWNLFNRKSISLLATNSNFEIAYLGTQYSPVNWVYSIHNRLVDKKASQWLINQFTLKSPLSLIFFTIIDFTLQKLGNGGLLRVVLKKPVV